MNVYNNGLMVFYMFDICYMFTCFICFACLTYLLLKNKFWNQGDQGSRRSRIKEIKDLCFGAIHGSGYLLRKLGE